MDVHVTIENMIYKNSPGYTIVTGFLLYPLWFLGLPIDKLKGEASVNLNIYTKQGILISTYRSHKFTSNWQGIYYGWSNEVGKDCENTHERRAAPDDTEAVNSQSSAGVSGEMSVFSFLKCRSLFLMYWREG